MSALEQTPYYTLKHLDDGNDEKLQLAVQLPGVKTAAELQVNVTEDQICVHVPGRYKLVVPIDVRVNSKPQMLRFVKKKAVLKAELEVTGPANTGRGPRASAKPIHDSFLEDALRRRDVPHMRYSEADEAGPGPSSSAASMRRTAGSHMRYAQEEAGPGPSSSAASMRRPAGSHMRYTEEEAGPGPSSSGASMFSAANRRRNQRATALFQEALSISKAEATAAASAPQSVPESAATDSAKLPKKTLQVDTEDGTRSEPASSAPPGLKRGFFGAKSPPSLSKACPESNPDKTAKSSRLGDSHTSAKVSTAPDLPISSEESQHTSAPQSANLRPGAATVPTPTSAGAAPTPPAPAVERDIYHEGKQQANREAAKEFFGKGLTAMSQGEHERSLYLMQKAARLAHPDDQIAKDIDMFMSLAEQAKKTMAGKEATSAQAARDGAANEANDASGHSSASTDETELSCDGHDDNVSLDSSVRDLVSDDEDAASDGWEARTDRRPAGRPASTGGAPQRGGRFFSTVSLVYNIGHAVVMVASRMCAAAVPRVLPYVAAKLGRTDDEKWLRTALSPGSQLRTPLLATSYIVSAVAAGTTTWFAYWASRLVLAMSWGLLVIVWRSCVGIIHLGFWRPTWWFTWPLTALLGWQNTYALPGAFWCYPMMWWATGGGWWAVTGSVVTVALAVLGGSMLLASCAWTVVSWEIRWLRWWLAVPAVLVTLFGWLLLCSKISEAGSRRAADGTSEGPLLNTDVPPGATGEVARVLGSGDYFQVLELQRDCSDDQVRKAKKVKALATHPDKLGADAVGASLAFQRITQAAELLGESSSRRGYIHCLEAEEAASSSPGGRYGTEDTVGDGTAMACSTCNNEHRLIATDRPLSAARWCDQCRVRHPAKDGDGWLETTKGFFPTTKAYVASGGLVFDITAWVHCGNLAVDAAGNPIPANTHNVSLRFTNLGSKTGAPSQADNKATQGKGKESPTGKRSQPGRKRTHRRR